MFCCCDIVIIFYTCVILFYDIANDHFWEYIPKYFEEVLNNVYLYFFSILNLFFYLVYFKKLTIWFLYSIVLENCMITVVTCTYNNL